MTEHSSDHSTEALDAVAYLARSTNRVEILDALADAEYSRGAIAERTGASRTTVDRIVNELEDRGWAERTANGRYTATTQAASLMDQFHPFVDSVAALLHLGEAVTWLPLEELSIGLEHFDDATVRHPASDDPVETVEFMSDLLTRTEEFRVLSDLVPPTLFEATVHDRVRSGNLRFEGVTTQTVLSHVGSRPARVARWRSLLESGAEFYRADGPLPCNLFVFDETVLLKRGGPGPIEESYGVPIVSENDVVLEWAHDLFDRWRATATPIDVDAFGEEPPLSSGQSRE